MNIRDIINKKVILALGCFIMVYIMKGCDSESTMLEKHGNEFAQSEIEQIDWNSFDTEVAGTNIARLMAHDITCLRDGTMLPEQRYGLNKMYCNTAATNAIKNAQKAMGANTHDIDVFKDMPKSGMTNGYESVNYWRKTYEQDVPNAVVVIKDPTNTKISKIEKQFKKLTPGSYVRYYGHYNSGKKHVHTQMYMGRGFCDDGCFVPTKRGKTVMAAAFTDKFKYLKSDIADVYANNDGSPDHPIMDSIVIIDIAKIMEHQTKQR